MEKIVLPGLPTDNFSFMTVNIISYIFIIESL
ncbi:MAG: hypothetical protein J07HQW2_00847 [Haloquadratum walsbyi J07HQW2]|uniref:Uncharacterized protein n=1 Tax=Haloquadratum walsbyi J07HQW2 TaxID=1238425 RepID=U1NCL7_9EURY|nr:MAG: hypothetical protein J07HQW2_00847 [Haloquadratum walsbyi J07HQW2]